VDTVVTELVVLRVMPAGLRIEELAPGVTVEQVQRVTEAKLLASDSIRPMFPDTEL
jgi:acyl CoA:acetate/3-ketoacid CoA transferase beta subunit